RVVTAPPQDTRGFHGVHGGLAVFPRDTPLEFDSERPGPRVTIGEHFVRAVGVGRRRAVAAFRRAAVAARQVERLIDHAAQMDEDPALFAIFVRLLGGVNEHGMGIKAERYSDGKRPRRKRRLNEARTVAEGNLTSLRCRNGAPGLTGAPLPLEVLAPMELHLDLLGGAR